MLKPLKLPTRIDRVSGGDRAALKYAVLDALKNLHPDLYFVVGNITYDENGFHFDTAVHIRKASEALRKVAEKEGLRTMERIGEFSLIDYVPGKKKPYVLRRKDGRLYEAGEPFVHKVFSKNTKHVDAMNLTKKVIDDESK